MGTNRRTQSPQRRCRAPILPALGALVAVAGCPAPGRGAAATSGYLACDPIIRALADYHDARGRYPVRLDELVPRYLARVPTAAADAPMLLSIEYEACPPDGYRLQFRYAGPGMNRCAYEPGPDAGWACGGYY